MSQDFISLPHFTQSADGLCLPACVRMVLAYLSMDFTEAEVMRILETQPYGTPSFAVKKLTKLGLHVNYREWSISELLTALKLEQPAIIFVRTGFLEYWQEDFSHALVIVGAAQNQSFWVHDPALQTAPISVSWDGLLAAWGEFGYRGAVVSKE